MINVFKPNYLYLWHRESILSSGVFVWNTIHPLIHHDKDLNLATTRLHLKFQDYALQQNRCKEKRAEPRAASDKFELRTLIKG